MYKGINLETNETVVIKMLKPVKLYRILREVKVLIDLQGGPSIIKFVDIVKWPDTNYIALITEFVDNHGESSR